MGDETHKRKGGLKDWGFDITWHEDFAAGSVDDIMFPLTGTNPAIIMRPNTQRWLGVCRLRPAPASTTECWCHDPPIRKSKTFQPLTRQASATILPVETLSPDDVRLQVSRALDEFDDHPLDVVVRRTVRIAASLGQSELAVQLGLELSTLGGSPRTYRESTERLLNKEDVEDRANVTKEQALENYLANRRNEPDGGYYVVGLAEIDLFLREIESASETSQDPKLAEATRLLTQIKERVRHQVFTALCGWERQLRFSRTNEAIFDRFRSQVDTTLVEVAPELLDMFVVVQKRLHEAVTTESGVDESLAQSALTCRRILDTVADYVFPAGTTADPDHDDGHVLTSDKYRNRITQFVKEAMPSHSGEVLEESFGGLVARLTAVDELASKGVHADIAVHEAEMCAIHTYLVAGELLRNSLSSVIPRWFPGSHPRVTRSTTYLCSVDSPIACAHSVPTPR